MPNYQVGPQLDNAILSRFMSLLYTPSPSSRERDLADVIYTQVTDLGFSCIRDAGGNLLVEVAGQEPALPLWCYAAHMDEIGMVVTAVPEDGRLKVTRSGGLYPWKLGETPVELMGDHGHVLGLLSMGSTHTPKAAEKSVTWEDVWIETGLSQKELAHIGIRPGSLAVPHASHRGPIIFGSPGQELAAAWTFDDRLGCALQLEVLAQLQATREQPRHPTVFAFTHHEEGGGHGAKNVARALQPEAFIAIDGAPMPPDTPLVMDDRPATWSKDTLAHYDHALLKELIAAGREVGVEVQSVVYAGAASDASMVFHTGHADRALVFGCVRGNSHGYEMLRVGVLDNTFKTLYRFVTTR